MRQLQIHCTWAANVATVILGCFGQFCTAVHICTNCYFAASDQNSDITFGYIDPDSQKENNNLAIRRRFHTVTLTFAR